MDNKLDYFITRTDKHLDDIWKKLAAIENKIDSKHAIISDKVAELDQFKNKIIGISIAINILVSGACTVFAKFL